MKIVVFLKCFCLCSQLRLKLGNLSQRGYHTKKWHKDTGKSSKMKHSTQTDLSMAKTEMSKENSQNDNKLRKSTLKSTIVRKCR